MPLTPQMNDFLSCPICFNAFTLQRVPITLVCSHTCCSSCLKSLQSCPFDQTNIDQDLPVNEAIIGLLSSTSTSSNNNRQNGNESEGGYGDVKVPPHVTQEDLEYYCKSIECIKELALLLKPQHTNANALSRPMQRKLITLLHCQIVDDEGRSKASRNARSIGERAISEILLKHQDPHQLSSNLWAAVRARGCQFLGPAMQEEVLKLVLLALEDGSALSRKVLVMFVVQRLSPHFPHQASKTAIGHVIQLLYRASCFKLTKRDGDSSLMQLKEEYCSYEALRREHDTQIVSIALEAGLRISPDQWSSLLYGDTAHKSHMQSIIDKLQSPASFNQSIQELVIALQRTGDTYNLSALKEHFENLALIDPNPTNHENPSFTSHRELSEALISSKIVTHSLLDFLQRHGVAHHYNSRNGRSSVTPTASSSSSNMTNMRPRVGRVKPLVNGVEQAQPMSPQMFAPSMAMLSSPTRTPSTQRPCASVQPFNTAGATNIQIAPSLVPTMTPQGAGLACVPSVCDTTQLDANGVPKPIAILISNPNASTNEINAPQTPTLLTEPCVPVVPAVPGMTHVQPQTHPQPLPYLPDEDDQFIPFDPDEPFVSKYGPISRFMSMGIINTPTMAASGNMNMPPHGLMTNMATRHTNVILGRSAVPSLTLIQPLQQLVLTTTILTDASNQHSYGNVNMNATYVNHTLSDSHSYLSSAAPCSSPDA